MRLSRMKMMKMMKVKAKAKAKAAPGHLVRIPKRGAPRSAILASVHEAVRGLHKHGLASGETMREFDALCLTPVDAFRPRDIVSLRKREGVSQPVFAQYLNVNKNSVSKWERGENVPEGAALKLLTLVKHKGLKAIA